MSEPVYFSGDQQDRVREGVDVSQDRGDELLNRWSTFLGLTTGRANLVKPWQPSVGVRKALADYTLKRFRLVHSEAEPNRSGGKSQAREERS